MGYIRVTKLSDIVNNINPQLPYSTYIGTYDDVGYEIDLNSKKSIMSIREIPWEIVTLGDLRAILNDGYDPIITSGDPSLADNNANLIMFCEISESNPTNSDDKSENKVLIKFITKLDLALTSDMGADLYCYLLSIFLPNEYKENTPDTVVMKFFDSGMTIEDLDNIINNCAYDHFKEVYTNYKNYLLSAVKDINEAYKNGWYPRPIMELKEREEYND